MRTGKSKVIVDDFGEMVEAGLVDDLLVVAPGGAYLPWISEDGDAARGAVARDLPDHVLRRTMLHAWVSGRARTGADKMRVANFLAHAGPRVLCVNVEALSTVAAARDLCEKFLRQRPGRGVLVVSESVIIKDVGAARSAFVVDVLGPLAAYRRIETGLVSPRSPLDLYNQFRFLDWTILGHPTFATFRARYARVRQVCMLPNAELRGRLRSRLGLGGHLTNSELFVRVKTVDPELNANRMTPQDMRDYLAAMVDGMPRDRVVEVIQRLGGYVQTVPVIDGYDNVDELAAKIAPHSYRVRLEDCYDMPPSDYSFRDVDMHLEQRRVYEEIRNNACAQLESMDHVTATHVVVRMLRLHQVLCGHVRDEAGRLHEVPERRTAGLVDLLRDYDGRAVVWCSYDHSVRRVSEAVEGEFGAGSVARFWGGNVLTREAEEARFKTDPACRFMVATPDAGGRGREWSVADLVVFYSSRNDLDHREQAEDRAKADGKTRAVAYVDMRVPGTVEDRIIRCLREKIDMAAEISGDAWREWLI